MKREYRIKEYRGGYIVQVNVKVFGFRWWYGCRFKYLVQLGHFMSDQYIYNESVAWGSLERAKEVALLWFRVTDMRHKGYVIKPIFSDLNNIRLGWYIYDYDEEWNGNLMKYKCRWRSLGEAVKVVDRLVEDEERECRSRVVYEGK